MGNVYTASPPLRPFDQARIYMNPRISLIPMSVTLALLHATVVSAASTPAATPVAEGEQVVVTANRLAVQNLVDRKVYSIAADLQSLTGTVSDVLSAIPSVQLDVDGNISLRGDSNVTVLIDGRPSAQLQGSSVGDILQQMPANEIERIEVITNPPAQFKAEGTAGVINIVTKRAKAEGGAGSLQANVGNHDRWSLAGSGSYKKKTLAFSGSVGARMEERIRSLTDDRRTIDSGGGETLVLRTQQETVKRLMPNFKGNVEWKPDAQHTWVLSVSGSLRDGRGRHFDETDQTYHGEQLVSATTRTSDGTENAFDNGETLTYERTTGIKDEKLSVSIGQTHFHEHEHFTYSNASIVPPLGLPGDGYGFINDYQKQLANIDYTRPLERHRSVKFGYAYESSTNTYDNSGELQGPDGSWLDNPLLANHFKYHQTVNAGYGSFQAEQYGWTSLLGLRVESSRVELSSFDSLAPAPIVDTQFFPSLHLERGVGEQGTLSFNVGRRITRPYPESLDPHVNREDIRNLRAGNPLLRPQTTMAYEVGYSLEGHAHSASLTGYVRDIRDAFTEIVQVIDPNTVLSTRSNIDHTKSGGVEFTANGRLMPRLTYNVSGNLNYYTINFPPYDNRSATSLSTKASLDWKSTAADTWQVAYANYGKRITPQGSFEPVGAVNLGFRHQVDAKRSLVATVSDIFDTQAWHRYTRTTMLTETYERKPVGRLLYVGFVYQLGNSTKKSKREGFEYDSGGA
jgi:outer membrane receptor protein involved in Fe transport